MTQEQPNPPDQQRQQQPPEQAEEQEPEEPDTRHRRKPIHTYHCPYCNQLLLASTHTIPSTIQTQQQPQDIALPRRRSPGLDEAIIVPLKSTTRTTTTTTTTIDDDEEGGGEGEVDAGGSQDSYSILLSSCVRDKVPVVVRREDGFERRSCLRCGRCRVVMGYFLDHKGKGEVEEDVLYVLPGALVRTEELGQQDERDRDQTWGKWLDLEVKS
ncbi:hypothetical protein VTN31DRAFT_3201 [Thermomyces dupontii]|uniref:uncharacterized protein n=1 Tax=Talaromyces thermophilus TaxID=28565 RepID=UPI003744A8FD